ncbi:MAG: hypothetical protein PVJ57_17350 [Phycisphaerae bacterium]
MYVVAVVGPDVVSEERLVSSCRGALRVARGYKRALPGATIRVWDEDGRQVQCWAEGRFRFKGGFSRPEPNAGEV